MRQHIRVRFRLMLRCLDNRIAPANLVWTGDVDANWGTNVAGNTNWDTDTLPANGDDLIFPTTGTNHANINNLSSLVLNSISFNGTDYSVSGNSITLSSLSDDSTAGANALNLPIAGTGN